MQGKVYKSMSYEELSREAERLINKYGWYISLDRLVIIKQEMQIRYRQEYAR